MNDPLHLVRRRQTDVLDLFRRYEHRSKRDRRSRSALIGQARHALEVLAAVEEEGLYPKLERVPSPPLVSRVRVGRERFRLMRALADRIGRDPLPPNRRDHRMTVLRQNLERHVVVEHTALLAEARRWLTRADLAELEPLLVRAAEEASRKDAVPPGPGTALGATVHAVTSLAASAGKGAVRGLTTPLGDVRPVLGPRSEGRLEATRLSPPRRPAARRG